MCGQESLEFLTTMEKWRRKKSKKKERSRQTEKESPDKNGRMLAASEFQGF